MSMNRRDFLKMLGIGAGAAAAALCGGPEPEPEPVEVTVEETEPDQNGDIVSLFLSNDAALVTAELPDGQVFSGKARAVTLSTAPLETMPCSYFGETVLLKPTPPTWDISFQGVGPLKVETNRGQR